MLNVPSNVTASSVATKIVSGTAAWLLYLSITNNDSVPRYFGVFDSAAAPAATAAPLVLIGLVAAGGTYVCTEADLGSNGKKFGSGIFVETLALPQNVTVQVGNGTYRLVHPSGQPLNASTHTAVSGNIMTLSAWIA
jgi:hypothetical protein